MTVLLAVSNLSVQTEDDSYPTSFLAIPLWLCCQADADWYEDQSTTIGQGRVDYLQVMVLDLCSWSNATNRACFTEQSVVWAARPLRRRRCRMRVGGAATNERGGGGGAMLLDGRCG